MATSAWTLVDNIPLLCTTLVQLYNTCTARSSSKKPLLYLDLEGVNLCRHGTISILQIYCHPLDHTYLIDITTLKSAAFTTETGAVTETPADHHDGNKPSSTGRQTSSPSTLISLKSILESKTIQKAFFDVRNDSDALWNLYSISLQGVVDLQLMELAARIASNAYKVGRNRTPLLHGLSRCISEEATIPAVQRTQWQANKATGIRIFDPAAGGSYAVFDQRPLRVEILQYCVQDVRFLPLLWTGFSKKLALLGKEAQVAWGRKIEAEAVRRTMYAKQAGYEPQGKWKALAPRNWY